MSRQDDIMIALRVTLKRMIREKDPAGMAAARSALAGLENACAVTVPESKAPVTSEHITGASAGVGASEADRRVLTDEEVDRLMAAEIAYRIEQAETFDRVHRDREAALARYQATLLTRVVEG